MNSPARPCVRGVGGAGSRPCRLTSGIPEIFPICGLSSASRNPRIVARRRPERANAGLMSAGTRRRVTPAPVRSMGYRRGSYNRYGSFCQEPPRRRGPQAGWRENRLRSPPSRGLCFAMAQAFSPPFTLMTWPVILLAPGPERKTTSSATSDAVGTPRPAFCAIRSKRGSAAWPRRRFRSRRGVFRRPSGRSVRASGGYL